MLGTLVAGYLLNSNYWDNRNPLMKRHMWEVTQAWTGVPDLPDDARDFQIETSGDFLTRKFKSSFSASRSSIKAWMAKIPDLDKAEVSELPDGEVEYTGHGKEGATYFKLLTSHDGAGVQLFVSWN